MSPFRGSANIDLNQHKGILASNSITNAPLVLTGLSLTNAQPLHTAIVDSTGAQYNNSNPFPITGSITPSGTQDVNLTKVGGASIALGQTTMSGSLPVTIASNQSALTITGTVAATQSGTWSTRTLDGSGNTIGSTSNALDVNIKSATSITISGTVTANQGGTWNVGLNAGSNAIGSITNTSFEATQATPANLNATVVGTGTFATQLTANPLVSAPLVGQAIIAVSGTAVRLNGGTTQPLTNGIIISAPAGNVAPVSIGTSSVNDTADGTGNGYLLAPGASISFAVNNTNVIYINGQQDDYISWAGS